MAEVADTIKKTLAERDERKKRENECGQDKTAREVVNSCDIASPGAFAQPPDPKAALLQNIDDAVDLLLHKASLLRDFRRSVQHEPYHVADLLLKACELSRP